ncbi:MAG TPA: hypothetical protein VD735_03930 [Candidatus Saccharimonadales bacterium]|nr:hypothetical protein [Candidatus Saccharimonadales bacterium]
MPKYSVEWGGDRGPDVPVRMLTPQKIKHPTPGNNFVSKDLVRRLGRMPSGAAWLVAEQFAAVDPEGATAHINFIPQLGNGRRESRTGVQFGQMVTNSPSQKERAELVAVKPVSPYAAAREFGAMSVMNGLARLRPDGRGRSFTPLGFYRSPEGGQVSLITRYEHQVVTLDNLLWDESEKPISELRVRAALSHTALALADAHASGFIHGDPQPKNIGTDNIGYRYPDLEAASEFEVQPGVVDPFRARRLIEEELDTALRTLDGDYTDLVPDSFAEIYHDNVAEAIPSEAILTTKDIIAIANRPQYPIHHYGA